MSKSFLILLTCLSLCVAPVVWAEEVLLAPTAEITDGIWAAFNLHQYRENRGGYSVHITGITDATVVINGANVGTVPANDAHHVEIHRCSADCLVVINEPLRWIKVRIPAYGSGTISAYGQ